MEKLKINAKTISVEENEDLVFGKLIQEEDKKDYIDEAEIMNSLT